MSLKNKAIHIWILEDDPSCNFIYRQILEMRYNLRIFSNLQQFDQSLHEINEEEKPHLIIADITLPDGNFLDYLLETDVSLRDIGFLVVSSIEDIEVLRTCFEEGAIDYLVKPFAKGELLLKVERNFSQEKKKTTAQIFASRELEVGHFDHLTQKERRILEIFLNNKERTVNRQDLCSKIWNNTHVHPKTLDVHLYNLRKKIDSFGWKVRYEGNNSWSLKQLDESPRPN